MRWHKLHVPAFPFSLWLLVLLKAVACDGLKSVAVRDLEAARHRSTRPFDARHVPVTLIGLQLVGLNVKPGTVDIHVDVPDLGRDPIDDLRERVRGISHLRGVRSIQITALRTMLPRLNGLRG